jgi:CubicO group peptidase (beta-lactamase class C family)
MNKKIVFGIIVIIGILGCQNNQQNENKSNSFKNQSDTLELAVPEEVGMSSAKIEEAENLFKDALKNNKVLGYQILVARKGKVILHEAGGLRDYENKLPMKKNTLLNVASNTKSLTAAAILKLSDEKKISLDDYVYEYFPEFNTGLSKKITLKHLLLHQSGYMSFELFHNGLTPYSPEEPGAPSLEVEAKELGLAGPEVKPGTVYRYNNQGYNILAAIIEKISQVKLNEYFRQNFYKPLEMTETVNLISEVDSLRLSKQYYFYNGKWELMDSEYPPIARGNGGTISTAWDFAKFFQMLVYKGQYNNQRILKEETISEATSPLLEVTEAYLSEEVERELGLPSSEWYELRDPRDLGIDKHRGYGFVVSENGAFSHGGIYGTFAYADPNYDLVVIIFTQSIYGGNPGNKFIETIYDSIIE